MQNIVCPFDLAHPVHIFKKMYSWPVLRRCFANRIYTEKPTA